MVEEHGAAVAGRNLAFRPVRYTPNVRSLESRNPTPTQPLTPGRPAEVDVASPDADQHEHSTPLGEKDSAEDSNEGVAAEVLVQFISPG